MAECITAIANLSPEEQLHSIELRAKSLGQSIYGEDLVSQADEQPNAPLDPVAVIAPPVPQAPVGTSESPTSLRDQFRHIAVTMSQYNGALVFFVPGLALFLLAIAADIFLNVINKNRIQYVDRPVEVAPAYYDPARQNGHPTWEKFATAVPTGIRWSTNGVSTTRALSDFASVHSIEGEPNRYFITRTIPSTHQDSYHLSWLCSAEVQAAPALPASQPSLHKMLILPHHFFKLTCTPHEVKTNDYVDSSGSLPGDASKASERGSQLDCPPPAKDADCTKANADVVATQKPDSTSRTTSFVPDTPQNSTRKAFTLGSGVSVTGAFGESQQLRWYDVGVLVSTSRAIVSMPASHATTIPYARQHENQDEWVRVGTITNDTDRTWSTSSPP